MKTIYNGFVFALLFVIKIQAALATSGPQKEWTFLLFLNGHNNLSSFGDLNIKDMEKTGSTDQINFVVDWGKSNDPLTHRFLVEKSTDPSRVTSPMLVSTPNYDMGDYHNLVDFVKWGVENYPAKRYFVAVWNHGSGWHFQNEKKGEFSTNDISFDDNTGNKITTEQLGIAMKEIKQIIGRNVDIYGSDACLMAMAEVASEMSESVNYFVGSQDLEPGEGWPYPTWLPKWAANPQISSSDLSVLLSKEYLKAYSGGVYGTRSVTFSAYDMSKFSAVEQSTAKLASQLKSLDLDSIKKIKGAVSQIQGFYYYDYKDLGSMVKVLDGLPIKKDSALLAKLKSDIGSLVLSTDNSSSFSKATGLSIWLPAYGSSDMPRYKGLVFDKNTQWSGFLEKLIQ